SALSSKSDDHTTPLGRLVSLLARKVPGRTHDVRHYKLTPKGIDALREWMAERPDYPRLAADPILRLLAADLVGEPAVRESLLSMRDDLADLGARLDDADGVARTLPHPEKYLRLNRRLARRVLDASAEWLDEIERELDSG